MNCSRRLHRFCTLRYALSAAAKLKPESISASNAKQKPCVSLRHFASNVPSPSKALLRPCSHVPTALIARFILMQRWLRIAAAVRGHCRIKVNCAMDAVGACERSRNRPFEGLGALLTKRRNDTHGLCFASLAEIFASSSLAAAERAYRRVKKRRGRFEQFKLAKCDHVSARCAL